MALFRMIEQEIREKVRYTEVKRIFQGFSFEEKYLLSQEKKRQYLVRIIPGGDPETVRNKEAEFQVIKKLGTFSDLVPETYGFGFSAEKNLCYMILEYFGGTDSEEALGSLSETEQYRIGRSAGKELKRLHALSPRAELQDWHDTINIKYSRKSAVFDEMGIYLPGIDHEHLNRYVRNDITIIQGTERKFLHGDYHPANLIIREGKLRGIIDYNRYDWGDPVYDFLKVAYFTRSVSIPFAVGQIEGYLGEKPSPSFWKRYTLYAAMTIIPDLLWSHDYARKSGFTDEITRSYQRIMMVCADHEGFTRDIPIWYQEWGVRHTREDE